VSNYGAGYILAALPRRADARQVRVLIALETFRCDAGDGWRRVSQVTLAAEANVDLKTLRRARGELVDAKLIECKPGRGKGVLSRWKILIPPLDKGSITYRTIQLSSQVTRHKTARMRITLPFQLKLKPLLKLKLQLRLPLPRRASAPRQAPGPPPPMRGRWRKRSLTPGSTCSPSETSTGGAGHDRALLRVLHDVHSDGSRRNTGLGLHALLLR